MNKFKNILKIVIVAVIAIVIGYFLFTFGRLGA